jgi:hypothetical protein
MDLFVYDKDKDAKTVSNTTPDDFKHGIVFCQYQLGFLSWVHVVLLVMWATSVLLPGFVNGVLHLFPITIEILLVRILYDAIGLGSNMVIYAIVLCVIACVLNAVHLGFSVQEIVSCQTFLCETDYWFLFVFIFIVAVLFAVEVVIIYCLFRYKRYLWLASLKTIQLRAPETGNPTIRLGLLWMSGLHTLLLACWGAIGFSSVMSQGIWHLTPLAYEIMVSKFVGETVFYSPISQKALKRHVIKLVSFIVVVGVAINVTHMVFSILELLTSGQYLWQLYVLVVLLGILALLELLILIFLWIYFKSHPKDSTSPEEMGKIYPQKTAFRQTLQSRFVIEL